MVALEPTHRPDPGDGVAAQLRPQPAGHPRPRRGGRRLQPAATTTRPSRCSTVASRPGFRPGRRSRSSPPPPPWRSGLTDDAESQVPGGASYQLPQTHGASIDNGGRRCGTDTDHASTQALAQLVQHHVPRSSPTSSAQETMLEQAEKFGFNSTYLDDLNGQAESVFPDDMDRPQTALVGHRPVRRRGHPAADGDGRRGRRQRRHRDAALPRRRGALPRPRRARQALAEPALRGRVRHHRQRADQDAHGDGHLRHGGARRHPRRPGRRQDRHGRELRRLQRPTRGSSASHRPTTRRSRSR